MRILAISHNFPHEEDPSCGIFVARQFSEMVRQGAAVEALIPHIYAPGFVHKIERYKDFSPTRALISDGFFQTRLLPYVRPPGRFFLPYDGWLSYWAARGKIKKLHWQFPFDVVVGRGFWMEADLALRLGRHLNIPSVGVAIGSDVNIMPTYGDRYLRHFLHVAENITSAVATGKGLADKISNAVNRRVPVVYGLVDLNHFHPTENKDKVRQTLQIGDGLTILYVGHLKKEKGVYDLIAAFQQVAGVNQKLRLIFCGDGGERKNLQHLINGLTRKMDISLIGEVNPHDIHKWMQASDIFVLPSYHEGMPNVVMEAMACGLPVITTSVGGLPDALEGSKGAVLVPPRCVPELRDAMVKLVTDGGLRQMMGAEARKLAERQFGIENNVSRLLCILKETVDCYKAGKEPFQ